MKRETIIAILVTLILLVTLGYFVYNDFKNQSVNNSGNATTTGDRILEENDQITVSFGDENIEKILPDLDRKFVVPDYYSEEIKENSIKQYNKIVLSLKEELDQRNEWLNLALLRNATEDYKGAEEVWLFMTQIWALDHVAFGNLGNLYNTNLRDDQKALDFYRLALERRPDNLNYYDNLYNIFRFKFNNSADALSLLEQGEGLLPKEIYFPRKQAEHYRDTGDSENARKHFKRMIELAEELDLLDLKAYAEEELKKI